MAAVVGEDKYGDREQVRRAQKGDLRAYEQLVLWHERKAYGLAFSIMGNREDAEDMLQESFLQAFQALRQFRGDSSFKIGPGRPTWIGVLACGMPNGAGSPSPARGAGVGRRARVG